MSIFKSCDVRGVVGEEWDVDDALRIGWSLGRMLRRRGETTICVGGDFRRSTPPLQAALIRGLRQLGIDVDDVGQVPTPVVQFAARQSGCANLAIVTASHNPGKYNGIKFLVGGRPPIPALMTELQSGMTAPDPTITTGTLTSCHVLADYESHVLSLAQTLVAQAPDPGGSGCNTGQEVLTQPDEVLPVRSAEDPPVVDDPAVPRRVAVDTMGGACTELAPRVLRAAGYDVVTLESAFDPDFSRRDPNPSQDRNLARLIEVVRRERADVGIALDGDGDRVIFVDAWGRIARPEQIAALLVEQYCPGATVVYDLKCASIVPQTVLRCGGTPLMQPSGHGFIRTMMLDQQAALGVEVSGHHFFGALHGGDDGLFTALVVLTLLRRLQSPLHVQMQRIGWPDITPDLRVPLLGDSAATLEALAAQCGGQVSRMDGVRAEYADGWGLARASITEPAMTFRFEGRDRDALRQVVSRFLAGVPELCQQLMERIS